MEKTTVSIIIPAYNAERFLAYSLRSCVQQTCQPTEIIVVDDGSTDGTLALAQEWAKKYDYVKVIHTENGGVSHARNVGLDAAQGAWITFLDADDEFFPNTLEILRKRADTEENVGIVTAKMINAEEKDRGKELSNAVNNVETMIWTGTQGLEKSLEDNPVTYGVVGRLFRKDVLKDVRFTVGKRVHEDSYFMFSCLLKETTVVVTNEIVYKCVKTPNSASREAFSEKFFDILYFANEKKKTVLERYPQFEAKAYNVWVKANTVLLYSMTLQKDKRYNGQKKECLKQIRKYKGYYIPIGTFMDKCYKAVVFRVYGIYSVLLRMKTRRKKGGKAK